MTNLEVTYEYPDPEAKRRLASLVGIDDIKSLLHKGLSLTINPSSILDWSKKHHKKELFILKQFLTRPPLFILAGDVGVGKTAIAESIGDTVARSENINIYLYRMSLSSRGSGLVGEMTKLVTSAFNEVTAAASKFKSGSGKPKGACILFIDEADALVQSRGEDQMHHEDRAGVNAVIRGIDDIAAKGLPVAVIMCTNRLAAIDPAIQRRASEMITFSRPNEAQLAKIFSDAFLDIGFTEKEIKKLVDEALPSKERPTLYTFSDLTQRYLPRLILECFPDKSITFDLALSVLKKIIPTPSFKEQ
jgi:SpoVK/Ycf46/Vps4 family AAA+-type ATPase